MASAHLEKRLADAQHEITSLRTQLAEKENDYQQLECERNYHVIKINEMNEIMSAKEPDEMREQLRAMSDQNAELTVQVQELRYHLNNASTKIESLTDDLNQSNKAVNKLKTEKKSHQKMLIEFGDVVRALGHISVDYDRSNTQATTLVSKEPSLENIKRKIVAIEEDRQFHIQETMRMQQEVENRDDMIKSLNKQNLRIDAIDQDRQRLFAENEELREECAAKCSKIEALEHLFQNINAFRTGEPSPVVPASVRYETHPPEMYTSTKEGVEVTEIRAGEDGNAEIVLATASVKSKISKITDDPSSEDSSFSSLESPEHDKEETFQKARVELAIVKDQYTQLQSQHESTLEQVNELKRDLTDTKKEKKMTEKKLDTREGLLRDVIYQYKELQRDHDEAISKICNLESRLELRSEDDDVTERRRGKGSLYSEVKGTQKESQMDPSEDPLAESPTFDSTEECSVTSHASDSTNKGETTNQNEDSDVESFDADMMANYKRLEGECARLEHEYDSCMELMTQLEEELKTTHSHLDNALASRDLKEAELASVKSENEQLKKQNEDSTERMEHLEEEANLANEKAEEAHQKQKQREKELWEVIRRYERLEEEMDETQANLKGVSRELILAKKQATRKDLIYDYLKLRENYDDALAKIESLERQLDLAKKVEIRSKEESKST